MRAGLRKTENRGVWNLIDSVHGTKKEVYGTDREVSEKELGRFEISETLSRTVVSWFFVP